MLSKKRKVNEDSEEYERFEEVQELEIKVARSEKKPRPEKRSDVDKVHFATFYNVNLARNEFLLHGHTMVTADLHPIFDFSIDRKGVCTRSTRMGFSDIIELVFQDYVLDALIDWNKVNSHGLPHVMYGEERGIGSIFPPIIPFFG